MSDKAYTFIFNNMIELIDVNKLIIDFYIQLFSVISQDYLYELCLF